MSVQVKRRGDAASVILTFTPAAREIIVDQTNNRLVLGDGITVGGWTIANFLDLGILRVSRFGIDMNNVADSGIIIPLLNGITKYAIRGVTLLNPSISLSAAHVALYTGGGASGAAICTPAAVSGLTSSASGTSGNALDLTLAFPPATFFTQGQIFFRVTTAQGAPATADLNLQVQYYN